MRRRNARNANSLGRLGAAVFCAAALLLAVQADAQGIGRRGEARQVGGGGGGGFEPMAAPPTADVLQRALDQAYLTPDEVRDLRVFHGLWEESDLDTPQRAAAAALIRGRWNDAALSASGIDPLDHLESLLMQGEYEAVLQGFGAARELSVSPRGARIRAEALERLGRLAEAAAATEGALRAVARGDAGASAGDVVEAVRMHAQRVRLAGPSDPAAPAQDYHAMIDALSRVRSRVDRLYWPALLAEAELLYAKDNSPQAAEALTELLRLNPSCARGWYLLGQMSADAFNFDNVERVALRLEQLAGDEDGPGLSAEAALLRARAALRQSDGAGAAAELDRALAVYPRRADLLAQRAAAEAVRFEFDSARAMLAEIARRAPGSPLGPHAVGRALAEARQYAEAAAFLEAARDLNPNDPAPLVDLGLLEVQAGRDERALAALERAFALDPFNIRADNSLRLVRELLTYERIESDHFVVRFRPGPDAVLAREMIPLLEEIHRVVCGSQPGGIDHEPAHRTIVDLMPNHQWFAVRIAGMPQIHTIAASTGPVIAMEAPREGARHLGLYDWVRVVRHEYVHTVTLSRTNNRIPHWFTEAAAVYLELAPRDYSTCTMLAGALRADELFDLDQINLAFVRPRRPTDRSMAYAQGHWMYEYIVERAGSRAPLELMDLYAQGVREEAAFVSVLGVSRAQFLEEFKAWARQQAAEWGLAPRAGEPDVRDLLVRGLLADPARTAEIRAGLRRTAADAALALAETGLPAPDGEEEDWSLELAVPAPAQLDALLAEFPAHPDLLEIAVDAALAASDGRATADNAALLERYAAARPVDPKPHRLLAQMYLARAAAGDADAARLAVAHLEYLDAREQKTPAYATELARRYAATGDWARARAKAERATQISPYDARPRELAATIAIQAGDLAAAERHILALTVLEPDRAVHTQRLEAVRRRMAGER
jgi:predicted Zn-dependent protease